MKYLSIILFAFLIVSCENETKTIALSADEILDESINVSGGDLFSSSDITFEFRGNHYAAYRNKGKFSLVRVIGDDSVNLIFDSLTNDGFKRIVNNKEIKVEDSMASKYSASINSVHYFSVLPYGLNDESVNKSVLVEEKIKNQYYYKIKVSFNQKGGGEDYEDVFVYWVNKQTFKVDYLAYSYNEEDGLGMRFREAYNERFIKGLRFVDYNNYKAETTSFQLYDLGKAFDNNQLKILSKIELENVKVVLIDN